jgi:hypothetical protein
MKDQKIHIVEASNGWVTFHLYVGMKVWVKKMTLEKFNKTYNAERHEQTSLF